MPGPRRGGVHAGQAPPHDRPRGQGRAAAPAGLGSERGRRAARCGHRRRGPPRPGRGAGSGRGRVGGRGRGRGGLRPGHRARPAGLRAPARRDAPGRLRRRRHQRPGGPGRGRSHQPRPCAPPLRPVGAPGDVRRPGRIAIVTFSVKPRGGAVHSVELAEALAAEGVDVTLIALGDPAEGFFRAATVPVHIIEAPRRAPTLTERVFSHIDALESGLADQRGRFDIVHTQDCISARAAARVRDRGGGFRLFRTVHHIDDFTTPALIECQDAAILEPDRVLVVSDPWRRRLLDEYGVEAAVVTNGVRVERFAGARPPGERDRLRARIGAADRHVFLTVGGIEPRKGSQYLVEALGLLKAMPGRAPMLAVVGGHSFQDYRAYRDGVLDSLRSHGLRLDDDVALVGTVPDAELPGWFGAADSFVFPSVSEGWGLAVLE
ncbi:MAG: MSMEG_0565 family glycosyltransferase, partial [Acidimicrobiaceae bacterium]|nr:MSMEG_0565 family glycosyltransferase [Acidimicrobiaceae bacterium]